MAVPLIYVAVAGGRIAYSFLRTPAGRKAAQEFAKNLVKRGKNAKVTNSKPPDVKVTQGPRRVNPEKPNQPVNPKTGKFQKRGPAPVKVTPKKPNQPVKKDNKPSNVPKVPKKKPNVMSTSPKQTRPGDDAKVIGGSRSKPSNRDYSVKDIKPPKSKNPAAALLRSSTIEGGPKVDTKPVSQKKPRKRPTTRDKTDRKYVPSNVQEEKKKPTTTKKTTTTKKSVVKPKPRPKTTKKPIPKKKPKPNPLSGISDSRRKSLKSSKIGTDAGAGMVWIVGKNTNAFVRVKPSDPRVSKQKQQRKMLKSIK